MQPHLPDGVSLLRRSLLFAPIAIVGGRRLVGAPLMQDAVVALTNPFAPLAFAEFGKQWQALADALAAAPVTADETYAAQLTGLLARVPVDQLPKLENGRGGDGRMAGPTWSLATVVTVEFQLDAGVELRLHSHPPQVVVTLCAEGDCGYRHFEIVGDAPACDSGNKTPFTVRLTRDGLLSPGRSTSLTRVRDGIHGFVAGERKVRLVDFTVSLSESEAFSYVQVDAKPRNAARRCHDAVWLGRN